MAQGSIRRRVARDGTISWRLRIELPPDPRTGQRRQERQAFTRKRDAEAALAAAPVALRQGSYVPRSDLTVGELLWAWYETIATLKPLTRQSYEQSIRVHLVPGLGRLKVQKLTVAALESWYVARLAEGMGYRSL
jgi:integrase